MGCSPFLLKFLPLVIDFFKWKSTSHLALFHCYQSEIVICMQAVFTEHNIYTTAQGIDQNNSLPIHGNRLGIFLNTSCDEWDQAFNRFDTFPKFQAQYIWFITTDDFSETKKKLFKLPLFVNSDVTVAYKNGSGYELYEVYKMGLYAGADNITRVGYWDFKLHVNKTWRWDLSGAIIRCPTVAVERLMNEAFEDFLTGAKHVDALHKFKFFTVLLYLKDMYHFSYEIKRVNSWGYSRNGSFDGIVGALHRGEADVGGSTAFFRADRQQLIDYIVETWPAKQSFVMRHPQHPGSYFSVYTRPLTTSVWCCIMAMLIIIPAVLVFILRKIGGDFDSSFSLAFLFTWSANCQQGVEIYNGQPGPVKILVFATFVYSLTLYQYYNAAVVSTLLQETPKNIRTLADLVQSSLKAGVDDVVYMRDYFKRTMDPTDLQLYNKKIKPDNNFFSAEAGMALVKRGGFAFHVDSPLAYRIMRKTFTEREICEAHEVKMYPPQRMAVLAAKGTPYKEYFTCGIRRMFEAGLIQRLRSVWDEPKPSCVLTTSDKVIAVSIRECSMALMALCVGMVTSFVILAGEIVVFSIKNRFDL